MSENENKIQSVAQKDAMVRFAVWDNGEKHELWKEPEMYHSFIEYYKTNLHNCNIDYVTGEKIQCSEKHHRKSEIPGIKQRFFRQMIPLVLLPGKVRES